MERLGWGIQAMINFPKVEPENAEGVEVVVLVVVKVVVVFVAGQTEKLLEPHFQRKQT